MRKEHFLSDRHFRRVICCPNDVQRRMANVWAVTWRPGDKTGSFLDKSLRPRTSPVCIVQSSEVIEPGKRRRGGKSRQREHIHFNGYSTQVNPSRGTVVFGGETANCFAYDFGMRPHPGAKRRIIDVEANPALVYVGLEMHKLRQRAVYRNYQLEVVPRLPTCYLGFYEDRLPEMEDTPALRRRVTHTLRKPIAVVEAMDDDVLQPLLRAEWQSCFLPPTHPINDTGLCLISHQLCSQFNQSSRDYLGFEEMMGAELFNPIRKLLPAINHGRRVTIRNPAVHVLEAAGYDPAKMSEWADDLDEAGAEQLVKKMRTALGAVACLFSDDNIVEFIGDYNVTIVPPTVTNPLREYGEEKTLRLMRHHCGRYSECCRDEDLLAAAQHPNRPLFAAGLVQVQVLYAPSRISTYYTFDPESLGLDRVNADFFSIRPWWKNAHDRRTSAKR